MPVDRIVWNPADVGVNGFWGSATSSIDWCESNYRISFYVAEFWNALSSISFLLGAIFAVVKIYTQQLPMRFFICHLGVALVGLGSFAFHVTLRYELQLLDELPMVYVAALFTYVCFDLSPIHSRDTGSILLPVGLFIFNIVFTWGYLYFPEPLIFQVSWTVLVVITAYRCIRMFVTEWVGTPENKIEGRKLVNWGCSFFLSAFALWMSDNLLCAYYVKARAAVGAPVAYFLEAHAWWHVLAGLCVHYGFVLMTYMSLARRDAPENYEIRWSFVAWPWVARTAKGWKALEGISQKDK